MDDDFVQNWIVEGGVCKGSLSVLCGKSLSVIVFHGDDYGDPVVVKAMVMPVSDSQFTFGDGVLYELSEFGFSVVSSSGHAILG